MPVEVSIDENMANSVARMIAQGREQAWQSPLAATKHTCNARNAAFK
jgi:hypothetical protein